MKKKIKKICLIILKIIIVCIVLFALSNVIYRKYEEKIFREEMNNLIQKNLTTDDFNTPLKTNGQYKEVEKIIKTYLNDYSKKLKNVLNIINNNKLKSILSADNYEKDGKEFKETTTYLKTTKETFNKEVTELIELTSKKSIMNYIKQQKFSDYYENLYLKYMLGTEFKTEMEKSTTELKISLENMNTLIDKESAVIEFLISCADWTIKDKKIIFYKQDDLITYNTLVKDLTGE